MVSSHRPVERTTDSGDPATSAASTTATTTVPPIVLARRIAATVPDPELPMLTVADLGILREVQPVDDRATGADGAGNAVGVAVTITPTYSGCPALAEIRADLHTRLQEAGFSQVEIHTRLTPPWTTDWITDAGRAKLAEHGIAPPGKAPRHHTGPIPLTLTPPSQRVCCPQCGSPDTAEVSAYGSTACKALWRCCECAEPFERVKEA